MSAKSFRASLDAWRDGKASEGEVEAALLLELHSGADLTGDIHALIDAYRNAGFVSLPLAERLLNLSAREPDPSHRTQLRPTSFAGSKTVFRPAAAAGEAAPLPPMIHRPGHSGPVGPGIVLSAQYALESIVPGGDTGSIGVVYRARDLIQEEAQDRNPFVAIKILKEWIEQDPEAIKALNREYKKTLPLSHPNIVKAQNLGRDGICVYLVMELLIGQSLAALLATASQGLPVNEGVRIAHALARALGYAHHVHLIHSDFKPSNAFITEDGAIKVMDFGIARAVSTAVGGDLPYASYEQIRGAQPDPRDDVYALGVVCYELLTGRHPFDRRNAVEAHDRGLKPKAVVGLTRRQWATLLSALSFSRDKRPRDARAFEAGLSPKKWPFKLIAVGASAAALVILAVASLTSSMLEHRRAAAIAEQLVSHDPSTAADAVRRLLQEDGRTRSTIMGTTGAESAALSVYQERARADFDPSLHRYDFPSAMTTLAGARGLLIDSAPLALFEQTLQTEQRRQLQSAVAQFERLLAERALVSVRAEPSVLSVLREIGQLDPGNALLRDTRIAAAFRDAASAALSRSNRAQADTLLESGLEWAPNDPDLLDLKARVGAVR